MKRKLITQDNCLSIPISSIKMAVVAISIVLIALIGLFQVREYFTESHFYEEFPENKSVAQALAMTLDDTISGVEDYDDVLVLDLSSGVRMHDFTILSKFKNVRTIVLDNSRIVSFEGLDEFEYLDSLTINNSKIPEIDGLNENLSSLTIINCDIMGDVDLGNMPKLTKMNLSENMIESLDGNYPMLKALKISNNKIEKVSDITLPLTIEELTLNGNPIIDFSGLEDYDDIFNLGVTGTKENDFSFLKEMDSLNSVYLDAGDMDDSLNYLFDNFRNGDYNRKKIYLSKLYNLEEE